MEDDKPVCIAAELPATLHRDLIAYAEVLSRERSQTTEPVKLIGPMFQKSVATDRAFAKVRRVRV